MSESFDNSCCFIQEPSSPVSQSSHFSLSSIESVWADEMDKQDAKNGWFKGILSKHKIDHETDLNASYDQETNFEGPDPDIEPFSCFYMQQSEDFTYPLYYEHEVAFNNCVQNDEDVMVCILVDFLENDIINPFKGSIALEKLFNLARNRYPDIFKQFGCRYRFRSFVELYPEIFTVFQIEKRLRIRLTNNIHFAEGDKQEIFLKKQTNQHIMSCLIAYLESKPDKSCQVDDFMTDYANLPQNISPYGSPFPLPGRGDFVRFIRKKPNFIYQKDGYRIILADGSPRKNRLF